MNYKVVITEDAENDLNDFLYYLVYEKKSRQAARNLLDDFEKTKNDLAKCAASLSLCENKRLNEQGYRKIKFNSHKYFMLYRIDKNIVYVDNIFHELQDYESKLN